MKVSRNQIITLLANQAQEFAEEQQNSEYLARIEPDPKESAYYNGTALGELAARLAFERVIAEILDVPADEIFFFMPLKKQEAPNGKK